MQESENGTKQSIGNFRCDVRAGEGRTSLKCPSEVGIDPLQTSRQNWALSWHIASIRGMQRFGCFRSEAEVGRPVEPTDSIEDDPTATSGPPVSARFDKVTL